MLVLDKEYTFRGDKIAWGVMGQGDPIVFVHGFPWSAQAWRKIIPWIAQRNTVYYYDMLGTGQSDKHAGQNVSENVQSDLLAELISHWQLERPQVVGHDFGGLAALRGHFVNGVEYGKLHLMNCVAILPSGSPFYAYVGDHEPVFAGLPDYAHEALFRAYIQAASHRSLSPDVIGIYENPWKGDVGKAAFYRQIAHADLENISLAQARYHKPDFDVHMIWGECDTFIPLERGHKIKDLLGAKTFTPVPNASHLVQEDAPEAIVASLIYNI